MPWQAFDCLASSAHEQCVIANVGSTQTRGWYTRANPSFAGSTDGPARWQRPGWHAGNVPGIQTGRDQEKIQIKRRGPGEKSRGHKGAVGQGQSIGHACRPTGAGEKTQENQRRRPGQDCRSGPGQMGESKVGTSREIASRGVPPENSKKGRPCPPPRHAETGEISHPRGQARRTLRPAKVSLFESKQLCGHPGLWHMQRTRNDRWNQGE